MENSTGVLVVNLGTPDSPTTHDLRKFLAEFLSDPRVIELPRWIWWLVLHGTILRFRPKKVAKLYASIWREDGSPLLADSIKLTNKLQKVAGESYSIKLGMSYGQPALKSALSTLRAAKKIIVIPLYPQHSATTTGSVFDAVSKEMMSWRNIPELHFISSYADHPLYLAAIAQSIQNHWAKNGKPEKLIFSYHGLPQQCIDKGDPYLEQCQRTTQHIVEKLNLADHEWIMTFQSRVGPATWLAPYTDETLKTLPQKNIRHIDIICPGFAIDCLETLEEIEVENKSLFLNAGGEKFHYIPALNDSDEQVQLMLNIINNA